MLAYPTTMLISQKDDLHAQKTKINYNFKKRYISEYFQKQRERNDNENIIGKQMCIPIDICDPKNNYNKITINS